jgi:hypothetical protein
MTETCANCKFYVKERLRPGYGECHAGRPQLILIPTPQGIQNAGGWAPCKDEHWCGEHKPKINGSSQ